MKEQDKFEDFVRTAVNELDPLPSVPREEMWARIEEARRFQRRSRRSLPAWVSWSAALAAMLLIGIALGRISAARQGGTPERLAGTASPTLPVAGNTAHEVSQPAPYRLAALQHLGRAEVLLTSVSTGSVDAQVNGWALDMLTSTRLLLQSPATDDPRIEHLLEDLELLLAQIANPSVNISKAELHLIHDGMKQTDVLTRVRATLRANQAGT